MKQLPLIIALCALAGCAPSLSKNATEAYPDSQAIQRIVEERVKSAKASLRPKAMVVVVAEPKTGKIVAISGYEKGSAANPGSNSALAGSLIFEPASTFKPVTAVAALESGTINPKTKIFCENGSFTHAGQIIKDSRPLGNLTFDEILAASSNIGASKMALTLDDKVYYDCIRKFGFGEKSGLSIPMESGGLVQPPTQWDALTKARMAFGQNVAVTPIQLTMAYGALANGGLLMKPVAGDEKPKVVRRVCSERTANLVKNALQATPEEPTTAAPETRGVVVGGKTGTSLAIDSKGGYLPDQVWTMFVGFFPVKDPEYVITVVVDDADVPPDKNIGGLVAAPIFEEIAGKIANLK
jgi:cell division protein FtsI (penicillin-binding protein 3)